MKVILTHPYCWPYVRRGTERVMDGLDQYLTGRGHEVTTLSTRAGGPGGEEAQDQPRRHLYPLPWHPALARLRIAPYHSFFPPALWGLSRLEAEVVHSFLFTDALAAQMLRRRKGFKSILQINGPAIPAAFRRWLPPDQWLVKRAIQGADRVIACSRFVADLFAHYYGVESRVIVPPIDTAQFPLRTSPPPVDPILLAVADFDERRKGARVLVRAFRHVQERIPAARLWMSGKLGEATRAEMLAPIPDRTQRQIHLLGLGRIGDVPRLYQQASLLVLPSMWEASGTVMFEAWSSGTPVVATAHGGLPEFVTPQVGVLFDPATDGYETDNDKGLAQAILSGLDLASQPGIAQRCREHAQGYAWEALGPLIEDAYRF